MAITSKQFQTSDITLAENYAIGSLFISLSNRAKRPVTTNRNKHTRSNNCVPLSATWECHDRYTRTYMFPIFYGILYPSSPYKWIKPLLTLKRVNRYTFELPQKTSKSTPLCVMCCDGAGAWPTLAMHQGGWWVNCCWLEWVGGWGGIQYKGDSEIQTHLNMKNVWQRKDRSEGRLQWARDNPKSRNKEAKLEANDPSPCSALLTRGAARRSVRQ